MVLMATKYLTTTSLITGSPRLIIPAAVVVDVVVLVKLLQQVVVMNVPNVMGSKDTSSQFLNVFAIALILVSQISSLIF